MGQGSRGSESMGQGIHVAARFLGFQGLANGDFPWSPWDLFAVVDAKLLFYAREALRSSFLPGLSSFVTGSRAQLWL